MIHHFKNLHPIYHAGLCGAIATAVIVTWFQPSLAAVSDLPGYNATYTAPKDFLDFRKWNLTIPIDDFWGTGGSGNVQYPAAEIVDSELLSGYRWRYFYTDPNGWVVFHNPSNGAATTPQTRSNHTRSELRALYTGTGNLDGRNFSSNVGGVIHGIARVDRVAQNSREATIAQIHGSDFFFVILWYDKEAKEVELSWLSERKPASATNKKIVVPIAHDVELGDTITYSLAYSGSTLSVTVNGSSYFTGSLDSSWAGKRVFFKAGAYHSPPNDNIGNPDWDYTQVAYKHLRVAYGADVNRNATTTLTSSTGTIILGNPVTLTWSSNQTPCTATGAWPTTGARAMSGSETVTPTSTGSKTYTITCNGVSASKTVVVNPVPFTTLTSSTGTIILGNPVTLTWSSNQTPCTASGDWLGARAQSWSLVVTPSSVGTKTYALTCNGARANATVIVNATATPTTTLTITPERVRPNQPATVTWDSQKSSCTATSAWTGTKTGSGSAIVSFSTVGERVFTLKCGTDTAVSATLLVTNLRIAPTPNKPGIMAPVAPIKRRP